MVKALCIGALGALALGFIVFAPASFAVSRTVPVEVTFVDTASIGAEKTTESTSVGYSGGSAQSALIETEREGDIESFDVTIGRSSPIAIDNGYNEIRITYY